MTLSTIVTVATLSLAIPACSTEGGLTPCEQAVVLTGQTWACLADAPWPSQEQILADGADSIAYCESEPPNDLKACIAELEAYLPECHDNDGNYSTPAACRRPAEPPAVCSPDAMTGRF